MITTPEIRKTLRSQSLFSEFSDEELFAFIELLDPETYEKGARIVAQDDPGDCMYILVSGQAVVVHHKNERHIQLATLHGGDFFGEIALVDSGPRSADVTATETCELLRVSQAAVSALAGIYPGAAFKLVIAIGRLMVARIRLSNQRYIDTLLLPVS